MKITKVVVGLLEENCYVLEKDKQVIVVDPGDEYERIKKVIGRKKVAGVLITHNHFDHVGALEEFDPNLVYKYDNLEEGEHTIGPFNFEVIYTPGHTKDSVSYYFKEDNILFDGDFVFCLGIGRCDLDDGDYKEMMHSIEKIKKYPKDMIICPGHGNHTTLEYEMERSLYFKRGIMNKVVELLIKNNKTISTMESCTGGALVNAITNIPGASEVLKFSAVTYSNEYKIKLGVDSKIIDKYTVYSIETADEMSKVISNYTNSNYGVGITGKLSRPDINNPYGEDNLVFISIYNKDNNKYYHKEIKVDKITREENKNIVIEEIITMLINIIN